MRSLEIGGIRLDSHPDTLLWDYNKHDGSITAKLVYDCIVHSFSPQANSSFLSKLWAGSLPRKICCFIWLALQNKILTWDNLQKRGWTGPGVCALCYKVADCVQHLFFHCVVWKNVISLIQEQFNIYPSFQSDDLSSYLDRWTDCFSKKSAFYYLPFLAMWAVWKARNVSIFKGKNVHVTRIFHHISYFSQMYCPFVIKEKKSRTMGQGPVLVYPCGFFDGASAKGARGVGVVISQIT